MAVFTRRDSPSQPSVVDFDDGARVIHVPAGPACHIPKEELLQYIPEFTRFVCVAARERRYALMHANFWMSGLVAAELRRALGIPFVVTFHALGKVRRRHLGSADAFPIERMCIEERVVREADHLIAECPQDLDDQQSELAVSKNRNGTVPRNLNLIEDLAGGRDGFGEDRGF